MPRCKMYPDYSHNMLNTLKMALKHIIEINIFKHPLVSETILNKVIKK